MGFARKDLRGGYEKQLERQVVALFKPRNGADAEVEGTVRYLFRRQEHDGWGFAKVEAKVGQSKVLVTCTGLLPDDIADEARVRVTGQWSKHSRYGWQVKIRTCSIALSTHPYAVESWLEARFENIGPVRARRLALHFGEELWDVVEHQPLRLTEVEGIGPQLAEGIQVAYQRYKHEREVYEYLGGLGLGARAIKRALDVWGTEARRKVERNPYDLMLLPRTTFKTADRIALRMGLSRQDPRRIYAGYTYAAGLLEREGHTCATRPKLVATAAGSDVLGLRFKLTEAHFAEAVEAGALVGEFGAYFRPAMADAEHLIAERVAGLLNPGGGQ